MQRGIVTEAASTAATATPSLLQLDNVREFWLQRWSAPKLGWHNEDVNKHLLKYIDHCLFNGDSSDGTARGVQIFVPLCGKSVDLAYLAVHPKVSQVVGIDILRTAAIDFAVEHPEVSLEEVVPYLNECASSTAPNNATFRGKNLTILIRNLFDFLPMTRDERAKYLLFKDEKSPPASSSTQVLFDTIYDRASLVAIQPALRHDYVTLMGELLRPGGTILLIAFDRRATTTESAKLDGPPFSVDEAEVRRLFETQSWVESVTMLEEVDDLATDADRERWMERGVVQLYEIVFLIKKTK